MSEVGRAEAPTVLPGARFSDTFSAVSRQLVDANTALERGFGGFPGWVEALMRLRNRIVRPFGLKTPQQAVGQARKVIFPVLEQSPERVVLGTDDRHLDFRVILGTCELNEGRTRISCTTLVRPHNLAGWLYLGAVLPFHKLIVASTVRRMRA
ncbi:DUF2867 domain-containing protein [Nitratireductor sp. GISD-1A_MAKvit]|uniref:DUF2867 domain-containing protein n=1 Tax=Nitratireductor sp. GISD-1A_MAKvit TaxID=3234198 RepID=UPI003467C990